MSMKYQPGENTTMLIPIESYPVVREILAERRRQNEKWGEQNHSLLGWIGILTEEVGEAAKEAVDSELGTTGEEGVQRLRTEMVQVAAVALQVIEGIDRAWARGRTFAEGFEQLKSKEKS